MISNPFIDIQFTPVLVWIKVISNTFDSILHLKYIKHAKHANLQFSKEYRTRRI
jgi:hypothetical protein